MLSSALWLICPQPILPLTRSSRTSVVLKYFKSTGALLVLTTTDALTERLLNIVVVTILVWADDMLLVKVAVSFVLHRGLMPHPLKESFWHPRVVSLREAYCLHPFHVLAAVHLTTSMAGQLKVRLELGPMSEE